MAGALNSPKGIRSAEGGLLAQATCPLPSYSKWVRSREKKGEETPRMDSFKSKTLQRRNWWRNDFAPAGEEQLRHAIFSSGFLPPLSSSPQSCHLDRRLLTVSFWEIAPCVLIIVEVCNCEGQTRTRSKWNLIHTITYRPNHWSWGLSSAQLWNHLFWCLCW